MKVSELMKLLSMYDGNAEVVINPDVTKGRYKSMPGNRPKRFSYEPEYELTERKVKLMGTEQDVICIGMGEEVGLLNPMNI